MEWVSGNIFIRPTVLRAGQRVDGHTHNFDHTTIVFRGSIYVRKWRKVVDAEGNQAVTDDGKPAFMMVAEKTFIAPAHFLVEAGAKHEMVPVDGDAEFWCIYSHRTPQGDVVETHNGWLEAYG